MSVSVSVTGVGGFAVQNVVSVYVSPAINGARTSASGSNPNSVSAASTAADVTTTC